MLRSWLVLLLGSLVLAIPNALPELDRRQAASCSVASVSSVVSLLSINDGLPFCTTLLGYRTLVLPTTATFTKVSTLPPTTTSITVTETSFSLFLTTTTTTTTTIVETTDTPAKKARDINELQKRNPTPTYLAGISDPLITQACECYANGAPPPTTSETFDVTTTTTTQSTIIATGTITTTTTTSTTTSTTAIATSTLVIQPASLGLLASDNGFWTLVFGPEDYYNDPHMQTPTFTYPATTSFSTVLNDCANACLLTADCQNYGIEVSFYTPDDLWWCIVMSGDPTIDTVGNAGDFLYFQYWQLDLF